MFIFTLRNSCRCNKKLAVPGRKGRRIRFRTCPGVRVVRGLLLAIILAAPAWPADAIEFVTREAFNVEKSSYKNYPYRVLFDKFHSSEGLEKKKIRNVIILKQVFDPEIRQRAIAAGEKFETYYGVVKRLGEDSLRLWLPESDSFKDFPVGFDRIPVDNKHDYPATAANISNFAAIVHIMDNRVYKVEISFALPAPEELKVQRRGENNVVSWQAPENVRAPSGYRVFVNDKLYKTVTGTSLEVPRSREQADEFFVKAVYAHQKGRIASAASPTLYDAASAQEIEKRQQAGDVYNQFAAALARSDQQTARKLMDANLPLFTDFLSPDRQTHILTAGTFFKALDEGDRLTALRPETPNNLTGARTAFQRAAHAASRLPAHFKLSEVARARLDANRNLTARLTQRMQTEKAGQIFAQISAGLQPGHWEKARKTLYQQQAFLREHLEQKNISAVEALAGFFQSIEKGDLSAGIQPITSRHLETALQNYRQAEKESRTLPETLDAGFIARQRIKATTNRQAALATEQLTRLATQTWDKLVMDLNPSGWQSAKTTLYANQSSLAANLPPENKAILVTLVDFFTSVDEGDRLAASQPATIKNLDTAAMYYQRATQKAATLPDSLDVGFITQLKTNEIKSLKNTLEAELLKQESNQTFDRVTAALDTGQWREARGLLYAKQDLLTRHLDARRKSDCLTLIGFFRNIDKGDSLAGIQPATELNLDSALESYRQAVARAQTLPTSLDVGLIARQKIRTVVAQKDQLSKGAQETHARQVYDQILATLTPTDWKNTRPLLAENEALLAAHLDTERKAMVTRLLTFFQLIEDGDRLSAQPPITVDNLNMALSSYRLADQKTRELAEAADLSFLTELKIKTNGAQRAALETRAKQAGAREIYQEIEATLNPTGWETGMKLSLDKLPPVVANLDSVRRSSARLLIGFFQDIEAGDRLSFKRPETDSNLAEANGHYLQAADKAKSLTGSLDVRFIARSRLDALTAQRAALVQRQQALMAAQQVPVPAPVSPKAPSAPPAPAAAPKAAPPASAFDDSVDPKTALKRGMKAFSAQNYDLAYKYFKRVYPKQIRKLKKAGKKQSFAVLSVSPKVRAETLFLVQLDLLKEKSIDDADFVRDGLMEMLEDVESGSGVWTIIKERKRNRIMKHIDHYPF